MLSARTSSAAHLIPSAALLNRTEANGDSYETGAFNRLVSDGYYRYEYDPEGNLVKRYHDIGSGNVGTLGTGDTDITTYAYDIRNRLVEVKHLGDYASLSFGSGISNKAVDYLYDAFNRRIENKEDANGAQTGGESTEYYFYDGGNVILDAHDADGQKSTQV